MKRLVGVILLAAMCLSLFAGCGGDKTVAQAVIDYEKEGQEEVRKLNEENPNYQYLANPVVEVFCVFYLTERDLAEKMIEKYALEKLPRVEKVYDWDSMVGMVFKREDFTEKIHGRIEQIAEKEPQIESLELIMERTFQRSYVPRIEKYTLFAKKIKSEQGEWLSNKEGGSGCIIKSKEELDLYLKNTHGYSWTSYQEKMDAYDEAFFKKNALIVTAQITRGSSSDLLSVDSVYISEGKAYVVVRTDEAGMGAAVMTDNTLAVKVKKSDVANITEVVTLE